MTREEAHTLLHSYVKNERTIAHCIASEAVMRALAMHLDEDQEKWGLAGLLHDLDVELTRDNMEKHAMETATILAGFGLPADTLEAVMLHNEGGMHGRKRSTTFQHALAAAETITGLIMATALVYPDKKLNSVKPKSIVKRMKEKAFAASVSRETIMECEKIGIALPLFAEISLEAMKGVAEEIGL